MKRLILMLSLLSPVLCAGCDTQADRDKLADDQRNFQTVAQGQVDALQWKLDDRVASRVFDDGTQAGTNRYLTFRKCPQEPPTHPKNRKVCSVLLARVAAVEAREQKTDAEEKAKW